MRHPRTQYISSTILSVLLHLILFSTVAATLKMCTGPVAISTPTDIPPENIEAKIVSQQEVNQYYERKQAKALAEEQALQLEKEKRARAARLAAEKKRVELLRQKKLEEEKKKQAEKARLERERLKKEKQQQAELRQQEEKKRLAEQRQLAKQQRRAEEKRLAEEQRKLAEQQKRAEEKRLAEEQRKLAEQQKRAEEKRLAEEQRRLAEQKRLEAEQLKMRKQQIARWERQYKSMIRNSVERHWKKPPASVKGGECVLKLRQQENGTIVDLNLISCRGDKLFVRSVEEAVWKANPLPVAPAAEVFDAEIEFTFRREY